MSTNEKKILEIVLELKDKLSGPVAESGKKASAASKLFGNLKTQIMGVLGAYVGFQAVKSAINVMMAFETSMRNVNSIMQEGEERFAGISSAVIDLSKTMPSSAAELSDALYDIASSGYRGAEALDILKASGEAAWAGLATAKEAADAITSVINAYGKEAYKASEVSDILFKTVDQGKLTFQDITAQLGMALSQTKSAGVSFEELGATISLMTQHSLKAPQAFTSMAAMVRVITKPTEELTAAFLNAGYASADAALQAKGWEEVLRVVWKATEGNAVKLRELVKEEEAFRGFAATMAGGYDKIEERMAVFADTTGATNTALDQQRQAAEANWKILKNNLSAILLDLSGQVLPGMTTALSAVTAAMTEEGGVGEDLTEVLKGIFDIAGNLIGTIAGLADKFSVLADDTSSALEPLRSVVDVLQAATGALEALATATSWADLSAKFDALTLDAKSLYGALNAVIEGLSRIPGVGMALRPGLKGLQAAGEMAGLGTAANPIEIKSGELAGGMGAIPEQAFTGGTQSAAQFTRGLIAPLTPDSKAVEQTRNLFKDTMTNIIATAIGTVAGGGGAREIMQGILPMVGMAIGGPIGGAIGGLIGSIFGKKQQRGDSPSQPQYVHIVNSGDMATQFLNLAKGLRLIAGGAGQQHIAGELSLQAARLGVA